jgi:DNA-binding CsgD family transcriptional regulator
MRDAQPGEPLMGTEIEVLQDAANGLSAEASARRRFRSFHTVKSARRRAAQKLEASTRTHAVAIAWRRGLIE